MRLSRRGGGVPAEVRTRAALPSAEKVLAHTEARDGTWVLGTRRQVVLVQDGRVVHLPWERVEDAEWDRETSRLRVTGIGEFGRPRPSYEVEVEDPRHLLQLVRERVTASIVLQRRVPVRGGLGLVVIGRRSPVGGPVAWMHSYDAGLDPDDPEVVVVAEQALREARAEIGETENPI